MKNMKISKAEEPLSAAEVMYQGGPKYPYGLRLRLEPAVVEKLQLAKLPEVGQMLGLHAVVEVVGVNIENAENGGRDKVLELQITDMELQEKSKDNEYKEDEEKTLLG